MKNIVALEEAAMFFLSLFGLYHFFDVEWWVYALVFIGPDISMIGYLVNRSAGATTYNLFHHKGVAIIIFLAGLYLDNYLLEVTSLILFGHSSMDRMFGYGLKLERGFKYTHLGIIGKK